MKLERLVQENIDRIAGKGIVCYGKSEAYLRDLCARFPLQDKLWGIIDDDKRKQGELLFCGRRLPVMDSSALSRIDWKENILLITDGYYREYYEALCQNSYIVENVDTIYYFPNRDTEYELEYREHYQNHALENIIVFRCGPQASVYVKGMDFADNARALFEYMLAQGYNERYKLVWLVKHPQEFDKWRNYKNVEFMSFDWAGSENREERDRYYRALCLAKYIFFTDAYGVARNCRPDQTRVQLWHGCGFKTRTNFVRCEKRYEYMTVISEIYSKIHQDIYGLRADQILVTGYAKHDWLFHPITDWQEKLGVAKARKYIFWLPTFRRAKTGLENLSEYDLEGQTGLPIVRTYEELSQLDELLRSLDMVLVLKLHPVQDREKIGRIDMENIVALDNEQLVDLDIQINQLLGHADAMISDYSSAAVDYLVLDRPIGFTLDDVEEYAESRGFVFPDIKEWLPGKELFSFEDFCSFVREIGADVDSTREKRKMLREKLLQYGDDNNCKRIIEALGI
ncbi:MAG: CDP-glycerol glycerophosphotransferase family protein [Acetatifactor sp.]|nr:CDP-glycerol glycerophosphotransferase family protein [Acetatifactor sp.]